MDPRAAIFAPDAESVYVERKVLLADIDRLTLIRSGGRVQVMLTDGYPAWVSAQALAAVLFPAR